jgi:hypothetical protein
MAIIFTYEIAPPELRQTPSAIIMRGFNEARALILEVAERGNPGEASACAGELLVRAPNLTGPPKISKRPACRCFRPLSRERRL